MFTEVLLYARHSSRHRMLQLVLPDETLILLELRFKEGRHRLKKQIKTRDRFGEHQALRIVMQWG